MDEAAERNRTRQLAVLKLPKLPKPMHVEIVSSDTYAHIRTKGFTKKQMHDYALKSLNEKDSPMTMVDESKDSLGDRLKAQERVEAGRKCDPTKPLVVRLDGRAFSTFTRGLAKSTIVRGERTPFDPRFSQLMMDTTKVLVEKTHAAVGFTQSDEITLIFFPSVTEAGGPSQYIFDGKYQKLTSVLAGIASAFFAKNLEKYIPEKTDALPHFDCRAWNVEDIGQCLDNLIWRQDDAIKNSISMAAQDRFTHSRLNGVNSEDKKRELRNIGHPWEDNPNYFKWGSFFRRTVKLVELTAEQLERIPEQHRPDGPILRSIVERIDLDIIRNDKQALYKLFT